MFNLHPKNFTADPFRDMCDLFDVFRQDDRKFFPAVPGDMPELARLFL